MKAINTINEILKVKKKSEGNILISLEDVKKSFPKNIYFRSITSKKKYRGELINQSEEYLSYLINNKIFQKICLSLNKDQ